MQSPEVTLALCIWEQRAHGTASACPQNGIFVKLTAWSHGLLSICFLARPPDRRQKHITSTSRSTACRCQVRAGSSCSPASHHVLLLPRSTQCWLLTGAVCCGCRSAGRHTIAGDLTVVSFLEILLIKFFMKELRHTSSDLLSSRNVAGSSQRDLICSLLYENQLVLWMCDSFLKKSVMTEKALHLRRVKGGMSLAPPSFPLPSPFCRSALPQMGIRLDCLFCSGSSRFWLLKIIL